VYVELQAFFCKYATVHIFVHHVYVVAKLIKSIRLQELLLACFVRVVYYGGKTRIQMLFKILAFPVYGENRNESIIILLQLEYMFFLTAGCNFRIRVIICWY